MAEEKMSLEGLHELCCRCLIENGCDDINALAVADTILAAERDGCRSHGILRMPGYVKALRMDRANGKAEPTVEQLTSNIIRVRGDNGFAPGALRHAFDPLAKAANEFGIAAVALVNIHHFAALWPEVEAMCDRGLIAFAVTSALPIVPPAGGTRPLFGTNPIAFGWPRADGKSIIFDQATATMAQGEILIAEKEGHMLPDNVLLDENGQPTNNPSAVHGGSILAFGGYKGALLSMMVELLAGPLIGEALSFETGQTHRREYGTFPGGELLIAIDPEKFGDAGGWQNRGETLFSRILEQEGTRLPSDRRYSARAASQKEGVVLRSDLLNDVRNLCGG